MGISGRLCRDGSGLQFGDVVPSETADAELRWFFNEAEAACEQPSNFGRLLGGISPTSLSAVEDRAEAMHSAGKIRKWLESVSTTDALMLEGIYRDRMWPEAVTRALGPLAGAVAASPTVKVNHLRALVRVRTEAGNIGEWLEELAKEGAAALKTWRRDAERDCAIAVRAYERARGKGECVVPGREGEKEDD
jgi:hypothetical protein